MKTTDRNVHSSSIRFRLRSTRVLVWLVALLIGAPAFAAAKRPVVLQMGKDRAAGHVLRHARTISKEGRFRRPEIRGFSTLEQRVQVPKAVMGSNVVVAQPKNAESPATALYHAFLAVEASHSTDAREIHVVLDQSYATKYGRRFLATLFGALPVASLTFVNGKGKASKARLPNPQRRREKRPDPIGAPVLLSSPADAKFTKELGRALGIDATIVPDGRPAELPPVKGRRVYITQSKPLESAEALHAEIIGSLYKAYKARRAGASRADLHARYLNYSRSDRADTARTSVGAAILPQLAAAVGVDRVLAYSIHQSQETGFFQALNLQLVQASGETLLADRIAKEITRLKVPLRDLVVLGPDVGAMKRAKVFARRLAEALGVQEKEIAIGAGGDKTRIEGDPKKGTEDRIEMKFNTDVRGKTVVSIDDEAASGTTNDELAQGAMNNGAKRVLEAVTHLTGPAHLKLAKSKALSRLFVTDTVPIPAAALKSTKIEVVPIATELANLLNGLDRDKDYDAVGRLLFVEHE